MFSGRPQFQLGWAGVKLTEDSSQNTLPKAGKIWFGKLHLKRGLGESRGQKPFLWLARPLKREIRSLKLGPRPSQGPRQKPNPEHERNGKKSSESLPAYGIFSSDWWRKTPATNRVKFRWILGSFHRKTAPLFKIVFPGMMFGVPKFWLATPSVMKAT